ncbi:polysaccharide deacetylase family protein [bacterium]|nr:MAG: polysaccharide deacetylase family protein [bacterium]
MTIFKRTNVLRLMAMLVIAVAGINSFTAQAAGPNLINNPSMEQSTSGAPTGWSKGGWGTNTASLSYLTTGCQNGTACLSATVSGYSNGDAKWYFTPITVTPNTQYTFSNWYQSGVATEIDAVWTSTTGATTYTWLGTPAASTTWKQATYTFTSPANASKLTIYHVIAANGTLKTDNYSFGTTTGSTPTPTVTPTPTATPSVTPTPTVVPTVTPTPTPTQTPTPTPNPTNLVANPGFETASGTTPANWSTSSWGTNTASFQYFTTGHSGSRSAKVTIANYNSGNANWAFAPQNVTAGATYQFTDWYKSTVTTEVDAAVTMTNGTIQYLYLGAVPASTSWAQVKMPFTVPAGAKQVTVYHLLAANGTLTTDDHSFGLYTPTGFSRGLVTVTLDDGWTDQYTNGLPILQKYAMPVTFYILSGSLTNQPDYMTGTQVRALATAGHEIGSHTVTHPHMPTLSANQLTAELANSQTTLQNLIGKSVPNFAYPYGEYTAATQTVAANYYQSQRSVETGYNSKDAYNNRALKVQNITNLTTQAEIQAWINQAKANKTWLILVYHQITNTPDPVDPTYATKPTDFDAAMAKVKASGLGIVTIGQGLAEVGPQL